ncbi:MAG: hypothetical protein WCP15_03095 [bacterium]
MKNQFQDMVPKKKNPLHRPKVEVPVSASKLRKIEVPVKPAQSFSENLVPSFPKIVKRPSPDSFFKQKAAERITFEQKKTKKSISKSFIYSILVIISVVIIVFAASIFFAKATITVAQRTSKIVVDTTITAYGAAIQDSLNYEVMSITSIATTTVDASTSKAKESKASGLVVVYNNYSVSPQTFVVGTRIQSVKGNIYKLVKTSVIPGMTTVSGKKQPGTATVQVLADKAGSMYNISLTDLYGDFTIPGLATNKDKFKAFYARLKTDITGGGIQDEKSAAPDIEKKARTSLQNSLEPKLLLSAKSQLPKDYTLLNNAYTIVTELGGYKDVGLGKVELTEKDTIYAVIFKTEFLGKFLARKNLDLFKNAPLDFSGINGLNFIFTQTPKSLATDPSITFNIKGTYDIKGKIDTKALSTAFAGQPSLAIPKVLEAFPGILKASISNSPFWTNSLPSNASRIEIKVNNE